MLQEAHATFTRAIIPFLTSLTSGNPVGSEAPFTKALSVYVRLLNDPLYGVGMALTGRDFGTWPERRETSFRLKHVRLREHCDNCTATP